MISSTQPHRGKGILVGDIIADVDGADVLRQPFKVVTDLIKGRKGTVVTIGFLRPKADTRLTPQNVVEGTRFEVKVRREEPGASCLPAELNFASFFQCNDMQLYCIPC